MKIPKPLVIILSGIIVLQFFMLIYLFSFKNDVIKRFNTYDSYISVLRNDISKSRNTMQEGIISIRKEIANKDSIIDDMKIEVESYDYDKLTRKVKITLIPKEITDDTKVILNIYGFDLHLNKKGMVYTGSFEQKINRIFDEDMDMDYEVVDTDYIVCIESKGLKKSQSGRAGLANSLSCCFPTVKPSIFIDGIKREKFEFNASLMSMNVFNSEQYFNFLDLRFYKNGVLMQKESLPLDKNFDFGLNDIIDLYFSSEAKDGDTIEFKIFGETNKGFIYDICLGRHRIDIDKDSSYFTIYDNVGDFESFIIRNKDNVVIYKK